MANGKINVAVENIFPLIKKFLYSDHEIFLRELIIFADSYPQMEVRAVERITMPDFQHNQTASLNQVD